MFDTLWRCIATTSLMKFTCFIGVETLLILIKNRLFFKTAYHPTIALGHILFSPGQKYIVQVKEAQNKNANEGTRYEGTNYKLAQNRRICPSKGQARRRVTQITHLHTKDMPSKQREKQGPMSRLAI